MQYNKNILLTRLTGNSKQTTGSLIVHDVFKTHAQFATIELPWLNNESFISCIPPGTYKASKILSPTFGWCIQILNIPKRTNILLHSDILTHVLITRVLQRLCRKIGMSYFCKKIFHYANATSSFS